MFAIHTHAHAYHVRVCAFITWQDFDHDACRSPHFLYVEFRTASYPMNEDPNTSPEKKLSSAELREKMKEEYKRELLARKQILEQAKQANKTAKLAQQLQDIEKMANLKDTDDTDEWIRRLNEISALSEAKLDIAMGNEKLQGAENEPPLITTKSLGDEERTNTNQPPATEEHKHNPDIPSKTLGDHEL